MDYGKKAYNPPPPPEGVMASTDVLGIAINTGIPGQVNVITSICMDLDVFVTLSVILY
jgi:hypothetical protein